MKRLQIWSGRMVRQGALLLLAFGLGLSLAWAQVALTKRKSDQTTARTQLAAAGLHQTPQQQEPPDEVIDPAPPILIQADATQTAPEDLAAFRAICTAFGAAAGQPYSEGETSQATSPPKETADADSGTDWFLWGRMATERAVINLDMPMPDDSLRLYAVHSPQGATVCLINRSQQKISIQLQLRLPRGVYKWERLSFTPPLPPDTGAMLSHAALREAEEPGALSLTARLDRLQSVDLAETDTVTKPGTLQPGELCLYRCTDVSRAARAAVYETRERLQDMARTAPDSAHRLRRILDEGGDFLDYVCAGNSSNRDRRLAGIHHFLLVAAQAHSLHHNFQVRHTISEEAGAATMGALERLMDGLAETSAAILGLVPKITVEPEAAPVSDAQQAEKTTTSSLVTLSIANAGMRSIEMVKIGLDSVTLPAGTLCDPEDPAFFGTLRPGQTVRATFHMRCPATMPVPANRCVGDMSYFVAGAPAHLRPRPW